MKNFSHRNSVIGIYLNKAQKKILTTSNSITQFFFDKLNLIYPSLEIYSNFYFEEIKVNLIEEENEILFLKKISSILPKSISGDKDIDEVYFSYFNGVFPLLSISLTKELDERHKKYLSQYSYSENLPSGIVPKFISREFIQSLPDEENLNFHDYLLKNINHFDVEIFFKEPDLRQLRLDFSLNSNESYFLTKSLIQKKSDLEYEEIYDFLKNDPNQFRISPFYLEIELYRGCENTCSFCPRQFQKLENDFSGIEISSIEKLISSMNENFPFLYTVCFGGLGEPILHEEFNKISEKFLQEESLKELIVETSLYKEFDYIKEKFQGLEKYKEKISIIINLSTIGELSYNKIYSKSNLREQLIKIDYLAEIFGKKRIHVQMLKILEVEEEIENYFNHFEKKGINVILQKYNRFGIMPEKRVSDLTPIHRGFCWHLARDLYIHSDSSLSLCKQKEKRIGNLKNNSLLEIWEIGMEDFKNSFLNKHELVNAPCLECDEWYTFNA